MMERHGDAPTIGMMVQPMRAGLTIEEKPVARQGSDDYADREGSECPVINRHPLNCDSEERFGEYFHRPARRGFCYRLAMLC